jgi:hypothetical protein
MLHNNDSSSTEIRDLSNNCDGLSGAVSDDSLPAQVLRHARSFAAVDTASADHKGQYVRFATQYNTDSELNDDTTDAAGDAADTVCEARNDAVDAGHDSVRSRTPVFNRIHNCPVARLSLGFFYTDVSELVGG